MMKSQASNTGQSTGSSTQKKSVFDRLGRQVDLSPAMKRRPSPVPYGDYMPPQPLHDVNFNRYMRDPHNQAELEWRYQEERRHMAFSRDRQPMQLPPPSPYEMEMAAGRQPPYYPHPNMYHNAQQGPPPPMMGPGNMPMGVPQQRSPKDDRHGNPIVGFKERIDPMRMGPVGLHHDHMSPPRTFLPPGQMLPPGPHEMPPMRQNTMYPPNRWMDNMEPEFMAHAGRMLPEDRFNPMYQQTPMPQMMNPQAQGPPVGNEAPRYTKWRERRDVITSLDIETAQSSSRTDSLKSSMQQPDVRADGLKIQSHSGNLSKASSAKQKSVNNSNQKMLESQPSEEKNSSGTKSQPATKSEPQDISDGEIVDDEDSSDENETDVARAGSKRRDQNLIDDVYRGRPKAMPMPYIRGREAHQFYERSKKRRIHDRDDYSMDYETISEDEDLDEFMGDKGKTSDLESDDVKLGESLGDDGGKSVSEIDLLNALGLDWANLVEMAKQSRTGNKELGSAGSALSRFSLQNYLPTLGISPELAGPELYDLVIKVCRS